MNIREVHIAVCDDEMIQIHFINVTHNTYIHTI